MGSKERAEGMSRRRFLAASGGAALVLGCAGCVSHLKGVLPAEVVGDSIEFPFSRFPALGTTDGYAVAGPVKVGQLSESQNKSLICRVGLPLLLAS